MRGGPRERADATGWGQLDGQPRRGGQPHRAERVQRGRGGCAPNDWEPAALTPGGDFFQAFGLHATPGALGPSAQPALVLPTRGYGTVVAWYGGPGLILYDVLPSPQVRCPPNTQFFSCFGKLIIGNQVEVKIIDDVAQRLGDDTSVQGTINIFSENPMCASCSGVVTQFETMYPGITVNVLDNNGVRLIPPKQGQ